MESEVKQVMEHNSTVNEEEATQVDNFFDRPFK
jgi:hypothetical protein